MLVIYQLSGRIPNDLYTKWETLNVWFQADITRCVENMTKRFSDHSRTSVHPLFSLISLPVVRAISALLDISFVSAARAFISLVAGLWILVLYSLLRMVSGRKVDATLYTTLALCGSASLFWLTVPETYGLGSVTLLVPAFLVAAATFYRRYPVGSLLITASALSLSITITNWMSGILAGATLRPWKHAIQITINAFFLVSLFWGIQKFFIPSASFFFNFEEETNYLLLRESGGPLEKLRVLFFHSQITPELQQVSNAGKWDALSIQFSTLGSSGSWGVAATVIWGLLLLLSIWGLWRYRQQLTPFLLFLTLLIMGQTLLHLLYGDETFLYTLHFLPLLITAIALLSRTPYRPWAVGLTIALIPLTAYNNTVQFHQAASFVLSLTPERSQLRYEMTHRPDDPWPRGQEHVVLAVPGSIVPNKAYLEAGGSFSPAVGSFGVALWLTDASGKLVSSSDILPLESIHQRLGKDPWHPQVDIQAKAYQAAWQWDGTAWDLQWQVTDPNLQPVLMIRSPGPAGGPIHRLDWDGEYLLINNQWRLSFPSQTVTVRLGDEREGFSGMVIRTLKSDEGWLFARVTGEGQSLHLRLQPLHPPSGTLPLERSNLRLDLPDQRFVDALQAQASHLLMGLEGNQTRPGEPVNYPLEWLRDGAYVVVALARAGYLGTARRLLDRLAEKDFFGGFGAEADAPGLALWAMGEVSRLADDPQLDAAMWPHVQRKLLVIREMLTSDYPIYHGFSGPLVPDLPKLGERGWVDPHWVADPVKEGLIQGKMDNHQPVLFVNAVTYAGLVAGAEIAYRTGHGAHAHWAFNEADRIKAAWQRALGKIDTDNPRTTIAALWPSGVAEGAEDSFFEILTRQWNTFHPEEGSFFQKRPLWTYFDIAQAHQWLFLNEPEKVWQSLRWFWNHQASPGLYSWWEGEGEENTFHRWEAVRGWVDPPFVTPHYWTAAEMLLLQLDMLVRFDPDREGVTIGAGVPEAWLKEPMKIQGMPVPGGTLDWSWDGNRLSIRVCGNLDLDVRLAPVFRESRVRLSRHGTC